jgi:hypothetical protein
VVKALDGFEGLEDLMERDKSLMMQVSKEACAIRQGKAKKIKVGIPGSLINGASSSNHRETLFQPHNKMTLKNIIRRMNAHSGHHRSMRVPPGEQHVNESVHQNMGDKTHS